MDSVPRLLGETLESRPLWPGPGAAPSLPLGGPVHTGPVSQGLGEARPWVPLPGRVNQTWSRLQSGGAGTHTNHHDTVGHMPWGPLARRERDQQQPWVRRAKPLDSTVSQCRTVQPSPAPAPGTGLGASDRCLQPQPPASLSSPRNNVGEQGLLAPRFTGRVETLRQEEGSSPAQAATMPPRATPSFLACGGANPRTGRGRPPAAGGLMDPRPARIYVFLLKMSPEVHSNARSRCQARARLILIKGKDDSLRERNRVPPSGK